MLMQNWQLLDARRVDDPSLLADAWRGLAARSLAPAGLSRPEVLLPLLGENPDVRVYRVASGAETELLLPVAAQAVPPLLAGWASGMLQVGPPHLGRDQGPAAVASLLNRLNRPLLLRGIPADGPFLDAVTAGAAHLSVIRTWRRAALRPAGTYAAWAAASIARRHRKEFKRQRARLAERGHLEVRTLAPDENVLPLVQDFLDLEAAGWKGSRRTAMKFQPAFATAFPRSCEALHAAGALRFWRLTLDGRSIASLFAIVEGRNAWLGKIAYDEAYARYSPGVLVTLAATESLFSEGNLDLVDSCAIPDHPMIDHLWRDRLELCDVLVAGPGVGSARFAMTASAERARLMLHAALRAAYYRLRGERRS